VSERAQGNKKKTWLMLLRWPGEIVCWRMQKRNQTNRVCF